MNKVYLVIEEWSADFDGGHDIKVFYSQEDAQKFTKKRIEEIKKEDNCIDEILNKLSSIEIDSDEQKKVVELLEYEYKNKTATTLETKTSVTKIKEMTKKSTVPNLQNEKRDPVPILPKFLQVDEETKITNAQKGTLVHLCMQKLDLSNKSYTYDDIKQLVAELEAKKIITSKEAEAININKVYQFTKSKIWQEMLQAKEVQREKPFYINIPAKEVYNEDLEEKQQKRKLHVVKQNGN